MTESRRRPSKERGSPGSRVALVVRGFGNILAPPFLVGGCLVVSTGVGLLLYPYLVRGSWLRDAAALVTVATVFSVFFRFWSAIAAGLGWAVEKLEWGCAQVRLGFMAELPDPAGTLRADRRPSADASQLGAVSLALGSSLLCLLVLAFAVAFNLANPHGATVRVEVENLRPGGGPALRSTVFFLEEAKFADWADDCGLKTPSFDAYESGVLEFLRPFGRCASDAEERLLLQLRGFASSSGLETLQDRSGLEGCGPWVSCLARERCDPIDDSSGVARECIGNAFNVCVAEERARQTKRWMLGLKPISERFEIEVARWSGYRKMAAEQIQDRENDVYDDTTGVLNRRVELTVVDTGTCQVTAQRPKEPELRSQELARMFLAWTKRAHQRFEALTGDLLKVISQLREYTGRTRGTR